MAQYEHLFGMDHKAVVTYLNSLHVETLNHSDVYTVYTLGESGKAASHLVTLKSGEAVFADATGQAVVRASDGAVLLLGANVKTEDAQVSELGGAIAPASTQFTVTEATSTVTPMVALADDTAASSGSVSSTTGLVLGVVGIGAIAAIASNDNKSGPPVPEPMTLIALGTGVSAFIAKRRKK
jgi:hypothetical protein